MASDPTVRGVLRGLLVLGLLWWGWTGYAWLGNVVRADEGPVRIALFAAMAVMSVLALCVPAAFQPRAGLPAPLLIAVCYFLFRLLHLVLFWDVSRRDSGLRRQLLRFTPSMLGSSALLLVASQFTGAPQTGLWAGALAADYGGTLLAGAAGWRLRSAAHFAERHGLILIIAMGESIVAIGYGVAAGPITWPILAAALLGLASTAALWWAYFDVVALVAERVLTTTPVERRPRMARDSYSYLHLPMVCGIVLMAFGYRQVLGNVAERGGITTPLTAIELGALYGGAALYLLTLVAFRLRNLRTLNRQRLVLGVALLAVLPVVVALPALLALLLLSCLLIGLICYEALRFARVRDDVRHHDAIMASHHTPRE